MGNDDKTFSHLNMKVQSQQNEVLGKTDSNIELYPTECLN